MAIYEACVGSYGQAVKAQSLGANRVELCDNLMEAGTTPSYGTIKKTVDNLSIDIMVIIRPRGGDFEFSTEEVEIMIEDIKVCKSLGVNGVVIGALKGNKIDIEATKKLIEVAKPMSITFHMAFDEIEDKFEAIDTLVDLGVDRILTKGSKTSAPDGKENLKKYIEYANERIIIMPGAGVTKENREEILQFTGAKEIHGTKVV